MQQARLCIRFAGNRKKLPSKDATLLPYCDFNTSRLANTHSDTLAGNSTSLRLRFIYEEARASFVALVSSQPQLLEGYVGTDAHGATVRRFTFVAADSCGSPEADAAPSGAHEHGTLAGDSSSVAPQEAAESTGRKAAGGEAAEDAPLAGSSSTAAPQEAAKGTDCKAARGMATISGSAALQEAAKSTSRKAAGGNEAASQEAAESTGHQLAAEGEWLLRRFGAAVRIGEAASPCDSDGLTFALVMRPNDPDWDPGRELHLEGFAATATYPAKGSFGLLPGPGLPDQVWPLTSSTCIGSYD